MANQPETPIYDAGVYQLEATDPVDGGVGAVSNKPLLNLADRTAYLKQHVDNLESGATIPPTLAAINSPAFTGTPTAPTAAVGDNSTTIATDQFVQETVNGQVTVNVAGNANVALTQAQWGMKILTLTGVLTGNISVIFPTQSGHWIVENNTTGAYTITCKTAAGTGVTVAQGYSRGIYCDTTNIVLVQSDNTNIALLGSPTAPTAPAGDNTQRVATDQFVTSATDGLATINVAGGAAVTLTPAQYGLAILSLTGVLTANINLVFPAGITGQWIVVNNTTGGFNVTSTNGGTGSTVVLPSNLAIVLCSDGTNVIQASSSGQSSFKRQTFSYAAGTLPVGTTSLNVIGGFTPGNVFVEKDGGWLEPSEFNDSAPPAIALTNATVAGDTLVVYAFSTFQVANAVMKTGDTMSGALALAAGSTAPSPAANDSSQSVTPTSWIWSNILALVNSIIGSVTGVTAAASDNSTKLSTTAWVWNNIQALVANCIANVATAAGFSFSATVNGYLKLPSWLGGFVAQWGAGSGGALITFPLAFPHGVFQVVASDSGSSDYAYGTSGFTLTGFTLTGTGAGRWIAFGY